MPEIHQSEFFFLFYMYDDYRVPFTVSKWGACPLPGPSPSMEETQSVPTAHLTSISLWDSVTEGAIMGTSSLGPNTILEVELLSTGSSLVFPAWMDSTHPQVKVPS